MQLHPYLQDSSLPPVLPGESEGMTQARRLFSSDVSRMTDDEIKEIRRKYLKEYNALEEHAFSKVKVDLEWFPGEYKPIQMIFRYMQENPTPIDKNGDPDYGFFGNIENYIEQKTDPYIQPFLKPFEKPVGQFGLFAYNHPKEALLACTATVAGIALFFFGRIPLLQYAPL